MGERPVNKLRNAFVNSVIVFMMIVSVSAVLAVFVHSILFMPAWVGILMGMCILLFLVMLAVEYSEENKND